MQKWIDASVELPIVFPVSMRRKILVYPDIVGEVGLAFYYGLRQDGSAMWFECELHDGDEVEVDGVTHWMYCPHPPKGASK